MIDFARATAAGLWFALSGVSYGTVSFQMGAGSQRVQLITEDADQQKFTLKGPMKTAGAHIQPIQGLPVAIGVVASQLSLSGNEGSSTLAASGNEFGLEACTWAKVGYVGFFLRGGKIFAGQTSLLRNGQSSETWRYNDIHGAFGVAGNVASSLSLMLEVRQAFASSFEFLYGDSHRESPRYLQSSSVLIGFEFGA